MARLNDRELRAMQAPSRRLVQRHVEMRTFLSMLRARGIELRGKRILDAGCGSGFGLALIAEHLAPSRLCGFDLMPEQVELAERRAVPGASVRVGDITKIAEPDASFDAVFVFGILHHVPEWRDALGEIARVLSPGGVLLVEELHGRAVDFEDGVLGMEHPKGARFDWPTFRMGLGAAGLSILEERALLFSAARSFLAGKATGG